MINSATLPVPNLLVAATSPHEAGLPENADGSPVVPAEDLFGALLNRQLGLAQGVASNFQMSVDDLSTDKISAPENLLESMLAEQFGVVTNTDAITELGTSSVPGIAEGRHGKQGEAVDDKAVSEAARSRIDVMLQLPVQGIAPLQFAVAMPDGSSGIAHDASVPLPLVTSLTTVSPGLLTPTNATVSQKLLTSPEVLPSTPVVTQFANYSKSFTSVTAVESDARVAVENLPSLQVGVADMLKRQETAADELSFAALALKGAATEKYNNVQSVAVSDTLPQGVQIPVGTIIRQNSETAQTFHPLPSSTIQTSVASSAWGGSLGEKVVWMVGQQHQGVELHLNPPALGPLEVRVSVSDGQANLSFMTQHISVRDAIEAATSRLREMLGGSGIGLGSVSVNLGTFAQPQTSGDPGGGRYDPSFARGHADDTSGFFTEPPIVSARQQYSTRMVDTFA